MKKRLYEIIENTLNDGSELLAEGEGNASFKVSLRREGKLRARGMIRLKGWHYWLDEDIKYVDRDNVDFPFSIFYKNFPEHAKIEYGEYVLKEGVKLAEEKTKKAVSPIDFALKYISSKYAAIAGRGKESRRIKETEVERYLEGKNVPPNFYFAESCLIALTPSAKNVIESRTEKRKRKK